MASGSPLPVVEPTSIQVLPIPRMNHVLSSLHAWNTPPLSSTRGKPRFLSKTHSHVFSVMRSLTCLGTVSLSLLCSRPGPLRMSLALTTRLSVASLARILFNRVSQKALKSQHLKQSRTFPLMYKEPGGNESWASRYPTASCAPPCIGPIPRVTWKSKAAVGDRALLSTFRPAGGRKGEEEHIPSLPALSLEMAHDSSSAVPLVLASGKAGKCGL